jgi:endo-1,4-beta-xylanase
MIIAPGGGHRFLNFDQEGTYVAEYLNSIGVAGFVLKYRLAREPESTYKVETHALADAQRAIRLLRSRAAEFGINPARVGIMGFSAGGEVAALAATRFDAGKPDAADPIDRLGSRPDFDALIYPGIRAESYAIPKEMPVTFMLCADNDAGPSAALAGLYPMLKAAHIQTEVHVYATGGHGFGVNPNTRSQAPVATTWQLRLGDWLKTIGMLKAN